MITFDLKLNEKDTAMVELWYTYAKKDYMAAIMHKDCIDTDEDICRRLEDGETVAVSIREIWRTGGQDDTR